MKICVIKMDKRGRMSLPASFLRANNLKRNSFVNVLPVSGRSDAIKLEFEMETINDNRTSGQGVSRNRSS